MPEEVRESRNVVLAEEIRRRVPNHESVTANSTSVFVNAHKHHFDEICHVAYDHGYVPVGITNSNVSGEDYLIARFVPRNDEATL